MKVLALTAIVAGVALSGSEARAADFNGRWAVSMTTESGMCDRSNSYVVAIEGARVRYVAHGDGPSPAVTGSVSAAGAVDLGIQKGMARADVTGRLKGSSGAGIWSAAGLCSGRWSAQRRGPVQASN